MKLLLVMSEELFEAKGDLKPLLSPRPGKASSEFDTCFRGAKACKVLFVLEGLKL